MSGHSKWATIKHKKAATDAKRGKAFTKVIREIMMAARMGGGNPDTNPRLRLGIDRARGLNMPNDNIQRAIRRGTGEEEGMSLEQATYEGYGPGGVAIFIEALTDNKNRCAAEVRSLFSRHNGNMGGAGSVAWIFERKGVITLKKGAISEDDLMGLILDAGAEDLKSEGDRYEIVVLPENFENVKKVLQQKNLEIENAGVSLVPKNSVRVEGKDAEQLLKLLDELEESEDVQGVYANFDIPDEILESVSR